MSAPHNRLPRRVPLAFMLSGSGEAPITTPAAGSTDCRTTFIVQPLAIQHY